MLGGTVNDQQNTESEALHFFSKAPDMFHSKVSSD